ncbi:MAG: hypothetical protein VX248_08185 [Pseudomonadota bacterium]|nr:hypothetical protein [Pseudomonadota bacterium]
MKYAIPAYILSAGAALAHTGHTAAVAQGDAHWLSQPDHLVVVGLAIVAAGMAVRHVFAVRRSARQQA